MSKKIKKDESPIPVGTRVRFTRNGLGGSPRDKLHAFSGEVFGRTDEGVVAFRHPGADNKALSHTSRAQMRGWVYVEVASKEHPGTKLYVPEHFSCLEIVS